MALLIPTSQNNIQGHLSVLPASVRGLTNIGVLTHMVLNRSTGKILATETFLKAKVEPVFGRKRGNS